MAVTADEVYDVRFERAALGSRGYHEPQVETFLRRIAATLEGEDDLTAAEVHAVSFSRPSLGKRGYDAAEVDAFLRRVEATLAMHAGDPAAGFYVAPALEHSHARKPLWRRAGK
jgi:DivIVA domain-containing protein